MSPIADTLDVLTLNEGKAAVKIATSDTSHDTDLAALITAVSRRLDKAAGPIVVRTITDELHDGGSSRIRLHLWPVTSVSAVTEYQGGTAVTLTAETTTSLPSDAYMGDSFGPLPSLLNGRIWRRSSGGDGVFPTGRRNVKVTYVAGRYANTAAVDPRFKEAAEITLQNLWGADLESVLQADEYDVPAQAFPRFGIPNAARHLIGDDWQDDTGTGIC